MESQTVDPKRVTNKELVKNLKKKTMGFIKRKARNCCSEKNLKQRLPIFDWLPRYSLEDLIGDLVAGLTVGLTTIPQAIAYAILAGLPPNFGLYSSFIGSYIYVFLGSCKDITIGPTAILSILTYDYCHGNPDVAILLCFTSSILILIFGIFNLGFLISFISKPVISGFVSAAAIAIASSQLKPLFGLKISSHGLIDTWVQFFIHIGETKWPDLALGAACIIVLTLLKKVRELKRFQPNKEDDCNQKALKMTVFLISVGRNAIVVVGAAIIAAVLDDNQPFTITGEIKPGLPEFRVPPFSTNNGTMDFSGMISSTGIGVIILPLLAVLESIAIGSAFSKGKTLDATQEMYALGICNLVASFFQSFPTTGSFSRTAVNATSGVRTTAGGIITGTLVILALVVLTPYFRFIPLSALAAVIICAVIYMIEYHEIVPIWKVRKTDQLVMWVSFLVCIFWKLEFGIIIGALVNLCILNYGYAAPKVEITSVLKDSNVPPHVIISSSNGLQYVNIDHLRNKATQTGLEIAKGIHPVIVDCFHFSHIDYSASRGMKSMSEDFQRRSQPLYFMNVSPGVQKGLRALNSDVQIVEREDLLDTLFKFSSYGDGGTKQKMDISIISEDKFDASHNSDVEKSLDSIKL